MHLRTLLRKWSRFFYTIIAYSLERDTLVRSLKAALVIGTLLGLINHGQALVSGHFTRSELVPLLTTYMVPFCVATYGQVQGKRQRDRRWTGQRKLSISHAWHALREHSGHEDDQQTISNQSSAHNSAEQAPAWQGFLSKDQRTYERHHCQVHDAKWKEDHEQEPTTAEAIDTMFQAHTEGSAIAIMPGSQNELEGGAALRQADVLEGRKLIGSGQEQDASADAGSIVHQPHGLGRQLFDPQCQQVSDDPAKRPEEQIRTDEDPGGHKGGIFLAFAGVNFAERKDHGG